ncbi:MAG: hypothetical protein JNK06_12185 [Candidatus Accumulibacter phosphatis]|uniref:hypothetical protein n=1 Tax=Candidatus Accumulibacter phosphatis TaxID=327160 RepID=UPI001A38BD42|nr:hypothetical protein [Candidatus Accumulibacter phosphatis]
MPAHVIASYKTVDERVFRVLVVKITSPQQVLSGGQGSIHRALESEGLGQSVGIYFYRYAEMPAPHAFTKIGEVSREGGVIVRKQRGWLAPPSYGDSYLKPSSTGAQKVIHSDVLRASVTNPMYFTYYEFDVEASFPKIDEIFAFQKHIAHFGRSTRNREAANTFSGLGKKLLWHDGAFNEVLGLRLPGGITYAEAI